MDINETSFISINTTKFLRITDGFYCNYATNF